MQHSLFGDKLAEPQARATDPAPSHEAARVMRETGEAARQREHALDLVYRSPGATAHELAELSGELDSVQLTRRLSDMKKTGEVDSPKKKQRQCRCKNCLSGRSRSMQTWWPRTD